MDSNLDNPRISVIVPTRGGEQLLARCLSALQEQEDVGGGYEVILVDDGSERPLEALAHAHGARYVRQDPLGPAAARNAGAAAARGEILAFTDADCAPRPAWLQELTRPFEDPQVVGVKGTYQTWQHAFVPRFVQHEYEAKYRRMARQEQIDFVDTYSAAYRREVFLENGGFESAFPVPSVEDQEFSFRLARKGYKMVFAPGAVVEHTHDETLWDYIRRKFNIGYWKAFLLRWLPEKTFSDSHTLPVQRWQILLLGLAFTALAAGIFWPPALWLALAALTAFFIIDLPYIVHLLRGDVRWVLAAPLMLIARAGALGFGLAAGLILAPAERERQVIGLRPFERWFKRAIDLSGASIGLVLSAPLIAAAGAAIRIEDGGPVFFRQTRVGEGGKPFTMVKLRTMDPDAEQRLAEVLDKNSLEGPIYKIPDDPRVTKVGRFLRRWSLDELPQLWNVLRGEMSLVGPRPEEEWIVAQYRDEQRQRLAVKPGLTGPMQISGRGGLSMDERLALELDYIENYSLGRDLAILLRTIPAVLRAEGAF